MGKFFLGGLSHLCPKIFRQRPKKLLLLTCKISSSDSLGSPHPIILLLLKIQDFGHFFSLDGMDSGFSFNKYKKKYIFFILAAGFCPKNLSFARKMMALPESGGCSPPPALWLVRLWGHSTMSPPGYTPAPWVRKRLRNFKWAFVPIDPINVRTKFEIRSYGPTRPWDNSGYSKKIGQSMYTPTLPFLKKLVAHPYQERATDVMGFCSDGPCECTSQI